jgi:hypothetical protein
MKEPATRADVKRLGVELTAQLGLVVICAMVLVGVTLGLWVALI